MNPSHPNPRGQRVLRDQNRLSETQPAERGESETPVTSDFPDEFLLACFVLRLVGVLAIFFSAALVTHSLVTLVGMSRAIPDSVPGVPPGAVQGMQVQLTGMLGQIGMFTIIAEASIALWGLLLFLLSPKIAGLISD